MNWKNIITALLMFFISISLLTFAYFIDPNKDTWLEPEYLSAISLRLAYAMFSIGMAALIFELIQRKQFMQVTSESFSKVMDQKMPERYKNLRKSGVVDAFTELKIDAFCDRIKDLKDCEIRIFKIFIPNIHNIINVLKPAIEERNCSVKIILLSPKAQDTIKKRAQTLTPWTTESITKEIKSNIDKLKKLHESIENKDKLKVRLHDSFVSVSLIGFGARFWLGFYLRDKLATQGIFFKTAGETNTHYIELYRHFKSEWDLADDLFKKPDLN